MPTMDQMKMALVRCGVKGTSGASAADLKRMCESHHCMPTSAPKAKASAKASAKPKKFIQEVMSAPGYRKGALTKKAKAHGETALEFAKDVMADKMPVDARTRKQAQFLLNIQRKH